jgi:poly(hydroxyalkanoate) depolymerase family esterase
MNSYILRNVIDATRLTQAGRFVEATLLLREGLTGAPATPSPPEPLTIDGCLVPEEATAPRRTPDSAPADGRSRFISAVHEGPAGRLTYRLYIPSGYQGQSLPLVIMLHGCSQSADDFAAGTRMNEAAEAHTCLVAYPSQTAHANASKCWNWFSTGHQGRGRGEPALIAGITRDVIAQYGADGRKVYVAGLSAGGAAAAVMGAVYPDLYAAIGVHSGLACGVAHDLPSAMSAMRQGGTPAAADAAHRHATPAIVFHGDRDTTVHPDNSDAIIAQAIIAQALSGKATTQTTTRGSVPGGRSYDVTRHAAGPGRIVLEQWLIHGAGHGWSGGSAEGSYTDPKGPDATAAMLRFFLQHASKTRL